MILQIALGVALGIVLSVIIIRYWRESIAMAILSLPVLIVLGLAIWVFTHPGLLAWFWDVGTYVVSTIWTAISPIVSAIVLFAGAIYCLMVLYLILLGPCLAYESITGKRCKYEPLAAAAMVGLLVLILYAPLLGMETRASLLLGYVLFFVLLPWPVFLFGKHKPNLYSKFKWVRTKHKKDVPSPELETGPTPPGQTSL